MMHGLRSHETKAGRAVRAQEGLRWPWKSFASKTSNFGHHPQRTTHGRNKRKQEDVNTHASHIDLAFARTQLADGVEVAGPCGCRVRGRFALRCVGSQAREDDVG